MEIPRLLPHFWEEPIPSKPLVKKAFEAVRFADPVVESVPSPEPERVHQPVYAPIAAPVEAVPEVVEEP